MCKVHLELSLDDNDNVHLYLSIDAFLCSEDRIRNGCKKISKSRQGSTQGRLDSFFSVTGSLSSKRKVHSEQYQSDCVNPKQWDRCIFSEPKWICFFCFSLRNLSLKDLQRRSRRPEPRRANSRREDRLSIGLLVIPFRFHIVINIILLNKKC